ncbi:hypothetical protein SAMN04488027_10290 [Psychroflexus sediminis]|uniref:Uncharacterized protein n=1 Tax=Psychroflexus sediminis TaxID=470826 RepID=A0A1G7UIG3_9FLAO|nr:hypothetical protein SAMN04488027_10290 [Psychroflexus sediminis]
MNSYFKVIILIFILCFFSGCTSDDSNEINEVMNMMMAEVLKTIVLI